MYREGTVSIIWTPVRPVHVKMEQSVSTHITTTPAPAHNNLLADTVRLTRTICAHTETHAKMVLHVLSWTLVMWHAFALHHSLENIVVLLEQHQTVRTGHAAP